ncbi:MAG TPA: hypothetical protein VIV60_29220 [Polyangiaceae bacterium]
MVHSKFMGVLFATCTLAASQLALAAGDSNALHGYNCRLVYDGGSFQEISGGFQAGKYVNISGAPAWMICPLDCEASNSTHYIYLSAAGSCTLGRTYIGGGSTSYYSPSGSGSGSGYNYYYWSSLTCSTSYPMEIQCRVPNGASVLGYFSY